MKGTLPSGFLIAAAVAASACNTIPPNAQASATTNACPAHPCDVYEQEGGAPACNSGVCTVAADPVGLLLVIALAEDSIIAPGRTYLTTLERNPVETGACALQDCSPPTCALLPWVQDTNLYLVDPAVAMQVGWYLGNPGLATPTAIPVQATYRPLLGASMADAIDLGLPLDPVQGLNVSSGAAGFYKGPNGQPALEFEAYMQSGCYERTLQPFSPLSSAFPPEIKPWTVANAGGFDTVVEFDPTTEETGLPAGTTTPYPTFSISRAEGLDGWTAYLRNIASGRIDSNVASLQGSLAPNVILATRHLSGPGDALDGLELVIAPPAGLPFPTEVLAPVGTPPSQELPAPETYPSLPLSVKLTGRVDGAGATPVPATVVFTATDIFDRTGKPFPPNFEFTTQVTTTTDAQSGASIYSATLPQGNYVVAVRPSDTSSAVALSTRVVSAAGPGADAGASAALTGDLAVTSLVPLTGSVLVADSRPLTNAVVEAVPTHCAPTAAPTAAPIAAPIAGAGGSGADASVTQAFSLTNVSGTCMPRATQSITAADGTFSLALDPGSYLLRVRPVDGSHLPWMAQSLVIAPSADPVALPPIRIPAPISFGMVLTDTVGNVAVNAIVRVFTDPSQGGPAVEVGRAITDSTGYYEMFLAPPLP